MNKIALILLLVVALAACASPENLNLASPSPEVRMNENAGDKDQASPFVLEGPEKELVRSRYQFDVTFNFAEQSISVLEQIDFMNSSVIPLNEILLLIDAPRQ